MAGDPAHQGPSFAADLADRALRVALLHLDVERHEDGEVCRTSRSRVPEEFEATTLRPRLISVLALERALELA
jgi:hypothetical protein